MSTETTTPARGIITQGQRLIYTAILEHWAEHGVPPTMRDLMKTCDIRSPNGIVCHLKALRRKGWLTPHRKELSRDIIPVDLLDIVKENAALLLDLLGTPSEPTHKGWDSP